MSYLSRIIIKLFNRAITLFTLSFLYPFIYKLYSKKPVNDNKVLFLIIRNKDLTENFKIIYNTLSNSSDFTLHCHFLESDSLSKMQYIKRCVAYIKDLATAGYVFLDEATHITSKIDLRKETFVTQLWHGCGAFKKFGYSTAAASFGASKAIHERYPANKNYSLVTVSSEEVIPHFEEAMGYTDRKATVKATGVSRTDVFFDKKFIDKSYAKLYSILPQAKNKKIILYAPTFRGNVENATAPDKLDAEKMAKRLSTDYILLIKHHPVIKKRPVISGEFAYDFSDLMSINELLCVSDICISDYSSLVFEFSLFEKPMIFFAFDLEEYFDNRGFYYDYDNLTPGPVVKTTDEIIEHIMNLKNNFNKSQITDFRNRFMNSCDGNATKRILCEVFADKLKHSEKKTF